MPKRLSVKAAKRMPAADRNKLAEVLKYFRGGIRDPVSDQVHQIPLIKLAHILGSTPYHIKKIIVANSGANDPRPDANCRLQSLTEELEDFLVAPCTLQVQAPYSLE